MDSRRSGEGRGRPGPESRNPRDGPPGAPVLGGARALGPRSPESLPAIPAPMAMLTPPLFLLALLPAQGQHAPEAAAPDGPVSVDLGPGVTVDGGPFRVVPSGPADRSPVLPNAPRWEASDEGDVLVAGPSGDPHVLHFAGGEYAPPADQVLDPRLASLLGAPIHDGRGADEVYGFLMLNVRFDGAVRDELASRGVRVLGPFPRNCVRVAMARTRVPEVLALPSVRWAGRAQPGQGIHPLLAAEFERGAPGAAVDVYINVFEDDLAEDAPPRVLPAPVVLSHGEALELEGSRTAPAPRLSGGWQERRLLELGVSIKSYEESLQAFRATLTRAQADALLALDFVQFLEADLPSTTLHETSQTLAGADFARAAWDGGTSGEVVAGIVDSGVRGDHNDFSGLLGLGWNLSNSSNGPWIDLDGHGTHVAGTFLGRGIVSEGLAGGAPGLASRPDRRLFNIKIHNDFGSSVGVNGNDIYSILSQPFPFFGGTTPAPHVVNHSYGLIPASGPAPIGSEAVARLIDTQLWQYRQISVFAMGNAGPGAGTLSYQAAAKNALSVGNARTWPAGSEAPGLIADSSSRGPCSDGRWKPTITAPGSWVSSTSSIDPFAYEVKTGTSMAAPHVTGIAAQLLDRYSFLRSRPESLIALLMATAVPRDGAGHGIPSVTAALHNTYGAGAIDASRAHSGSAQNALGFWGFDLAPSSAVEIDFNVSPGATKLTAAMFYSEFPAAAGAGQALIRNLDMVLDRAPFSSTPQTGDYTAHQSNVDNVEIRSIASPGSGAWKIKVSSPSSLPLDPKVGVAIIISYGDTTPDQVVTYTIDDTFLRPNEQTWVRAAVQNTSDTAMGVMAELVTDLSAIDEGEMDLLDGREADLTYATQDPRVALLGNIQHGQTRNARWLTSWGSTGQKVLTLQVQGENTTSFTQTRTVIVDGLPPNPVTQFSSPTHQVGARTCVNQITLNWTAPQDDLSGVDGYSFTWTTSPSSIPPILGSYPSSTTTSRNLDATTDPDGWWFHIRPVDRSGNLGPVTHHGPFFIGEATVTIGCISNPNSADPGGARIGLNSVPCLGDGNLDLRTIHMPPNQFGFYIASHGTDFVSFFAGSQGNLCLAQPVYRILDSLGSTGASGQLFHSLDFDALPAGMTIDPGDTVHFQVWFRDVNPTATSNTSNRVSVTFD